MKKQDVPQDNNRSYGGHKKVIYAVNEQGHYEAVESSGWDTEEFATLMAVEELDTLTKDALERVKRGESSPLEYHMYAQRFDRVGLAQATGFYQWQIKRHFKPAIFAKLPPRKINRYIEALQISADELHSIPN